MTPGRLHRTERIVERPDRFLESAGDREQPNDRPVFDEYAYAFPMRLEDVDPTD